MHMGGVIPIEVDVQLASHDGPPWEVASLRHREGWLIMAIAKVSTPFGARSRLLVAAVDVHGVVLSRALADKLHRLAMSAPRDPEDTPPEELAAAVDALYWDFLGESDLQSLQQLEAEQAAQDDRIDEYVIECQLLQWRIRASLRHLRAEKIRLAPEAPEQSIVRARIARLDQMLDDLALGMRERVRAMRAEIDELQDDVMTSLKQDGEMETLEIVRWRSVARQTSNGWVAASAQRLYDSAMSSTDIRSEPAQRHQENSLSLDGRWKPENGWQQKLPQSEALQAPAASFSTPNAFEAAAAPQKSRLLSKPRMSETEAIEILNALGTPIWFIEADDASEAGQDRGLGFADAPPAGKQASDNAEPSSVSRTAASVLKSPPAVWPEIHKLITVTARPIKDYEAAHQKILKLCDAILGRLGEPDNDPDTIDHMRKKFVRHIKMVWLLTTAEKNALLVRVASLSAQKASTTASTNVSPGSENSA